MKNTFKAAIIAVLALCLLASLAACKNQDGGDAPEWQTTTAAPADGTPAPDGTTAPTTTTPPETTEPYTGPLMTDGAGEADSQFGDLVEG